MARYLYFWEHGGGLGHLSQCGAIAEALVDRGHEVVAIVRDTRRAASVFEGLEMRWLACPILPERPHAPTESFSSYAQLVVESGWHDAEATRSAITSHRHLFELLTPDAVLLDHAPTVALALRGTGIPAAIVGTGFFRPPEARPMPPFHITREKMSAPRVAALEVEALEAARVATSGEPGPPLETMADLFEGMESLFLTYPELDHYPGRKGARYLGTHPPPNGLPFGWPDAPRRPRLFAYLKPFRGREALLRMLGASKAATVAYCPDLPAESRRSLEASNLRILDRPADAAAAAEGADVGINHAGHATICDFLCRGKPVLMLPLQWEQSVLAFVVEQRGLGLMANPQDPHALARRLERLLGDPSIRQRTKAFAARYPAPTRRSFAHAVATPLEALVTS